MASRTSSAELVQNMPANRRYSRQLGSARASRLSPGNHGGLGTQWVASYRDSGRPARWTATSWSGQAPVRTRSYKLSGARSAPPGQTTVPVSRSTVTSAKPSKAERENAVADHGGLSDVGRQANRRSGSIGGS